MRLSWFLPMLALSSSAWGMDTQMGIAVTQAGAKRNWPVLPVKMCINSGVPKKYRTEIRRAAAVWNAAFPKPVLQVECISSAPVTNLQNEKEHVIYWVRNDFEDFAPRGTLARTLTAFGDDGKYLDADIIINAQDFVWASREGSGLDLQSVMIHEFGHVFGLQHLEITVESALKSFPYQSRILFRRIGEYERSALANQYFPDLGITFQKYLDDYFAGRLAEASAKLEAIPQSIVDDRQYQLGVLYFLQKRYEQARVHLEGFLKKHVNHLFANYYLGEVYWALDDVGRAREKFLRVVSINPHHYEALANLAVLEFQEGRLVAAQRLFERVLKVNPVHFVACEFLFKMTRISRYQKCVKIYGNS